MINYNPNYKLSLCSKCNKPFKRYTRSKQRLCMACSDLALSHKKGVNSHRNTPQAAYCYACGKSLGTDNYLLEMAKKGYKLYCDNKCKAEEE